MSDDDYEDNMDWTPGDCCRHGAEVCDKQDVDACAVLMLKKAQPGRPHAYDTQFSLSGLTTTEAIALLRVVESHLIASIARVTES